MSWSIYVAGRNDERLIEHVKAQAAYPKDGDQHHINAGKAAILALLFEAPQGALVTIDAGGHHDYSNAARASGAFRVEVKVWPGIEDAKPPAQFVSGAGGIEAPKL
jgi:hypothetical protein